MAVIDVTDRLPSFNNAWGGIGPAQVNRVGDWTTPFVPIGLNLAGFTTDFLITPLQGPRAKLYPFNESVSPRVEQQILPFNFKSLAVRSPSTGLPVDTSVCPYRDFGIEFWFDRLHILPVGAQSTDLGNLVNDVDTQFELFNAHRSVNVDISTLNETGTLGFTILSGDLPPFTLPAYNSIFYTIRAEVEIGPPSINATYTWVPSTAGFSSVFINFVGNRITTFAFIPQRNHNRTLRFQTAIVESYNGKEQRSAIKAQPDMEMTYRYHLGEPYYEAAQLFEHQVFDSLGRAWLVPDWPDRTVLTAAVSPSDTVINVNTVNRNFEVGELVLLWRDYNDNEAQEITAVTSSTITVASGFVSSFAVADTVVLPSWVGYMNEGPKQTVFKRDYVQWEVTFRRRKPITYDLLGSPEGSLVGTEFYEGIPFWPRKWLISGNSIQRTWRRDVEFNRGLGRLNSTFRYTTPKRANSEIVIEIDDRTDLIEMRSWLMYLRGQQRAFWLPSYYSNLQLTQPTAAGGSVIRCTYSAYERYVFQREQFVKIRVVFTDGRTFIHEIIDSADAGGGEMDLTITPAVATGESPDPGYVVANIERIEYITKHRLATDVIAFQPLAITDQYRLSLPIVEVLGEV